MDHVLMMLLVLLSSSGFLAEEIHNHNEPVRLVGGSSHCTGTLEVNHDGEWRPVYDSYWSLKEAAVICRELDCGFVVSTGHTEASSHMYSVWWIRSYCLQSGSALRDCVRSDFSTISLEITCSDSVRLVNGTSLCSGRLEVSNQSNKRWSSVCEADFDQQDAEVVCKELGCGAPSVLQGGLYGEVEGPMWTKEFQCGGHESALLDCGSSGSARNTCSPGKAVGLTCSEPVRLVGGSSRCAGTLEMKLGEWRPVHDWEHDWTLNEAAVFCRELDCGSAVSVGWRESSYRPVWRFSSDCVQSGSVFSDCVTPYSSSSILEITCSALLVQPNISVSSSMDGASETQQQGFQVIRGSTFTISCSIQPQYPGGSFQLIFTSSYSAHNYTQPAVNHSAHFLFPGADPTHQGSYSCVYHIYAFSHNFSSESHLLSLTVSDLLVEKMKRTRRALLLQPNISVSSSMDGVSETQQQGFQVIRGSNFTISCSIWPQYPGGSFQLTFTSSNTAHNYTEPAVNHSAHFLFPAAEPAHQGSYSCVYHVYIFSHNFSSESRLLSLTVSDPTVLIIKVVVLSLTLLLVNAALCFYCKASRGQKPGRQENTELDYYNLGVPAAEGGPTEEEGAQEAEQDLQGAHQTSRWISQLTHNPPSTQSRTLQFYTHVPFKQ